MCGVWCVVAPPPPPPPPLAPLAAQKRMKEVKPGQIVTQRSTQTEMKG